MITLLLVLACPISMGAMMWLMMRGGQRESSSSGHVEQRRRIDALERELAKLRGAREHNDTDVPVGTAMPHARSSTYKN